MSAVGILGREAGEAQDQSEALSQRGSSEAERVPSPTGRDKLDAGGRWPFSASGRVF